MNKNQRRHIPPSRARYEDKNPVVSARVSKEMWEQIKVLRARGRSLGDLVRAGLGRLAAEDQKLNEAEKRGYQRGFEEAKALYGVKVQCTVCGGVEPLRGDQATKAAAEAILQRLGWRHTACNQRPPSTTIIVV